jgi:hypothetical protein
MRHFKYFPTIDYRGNSATNILARAKVRDLVKKNIIAFYPYTIRDEDTPQIIADKYYGTVDYTWILFYANDIYDPEYDWPLSEPNFVQYIIKKYGALDHASKKIHHFEKDGINFYVKNSITLSGRMTFYGTNGLYVSGQGTKFVTEIFGTGATIGSGIYLRPLSIWPHSEESARIRSVIDETHLTLSEPLSYYKSAEDITCEIVGTVENAIVDTYDTEFVKYHYPDPTTLYGIMGGAVSCYEYERLVNEEKRHIIVIDNKYVPDLVKEMQKIFK